MSCFCRRIVCLSLPFLPALVLLGLLLGWLDRPVLSRAPTQDTITVTQTGDSGPGSLRAAILSANGSSGPDRIDILVTGTLTLLSPLPEITDPLAVNGPGATLFRVDGQDTHQLLQFASTVVTITGITLQHGAISLSGGHGGAIQGTGTLHLRQTDILSNSANSHGGAIHVLGTLSLAQVLARNNHSQIGAGGVAFGSGTVLITDSYFVDNYAQIHGGVIYSLGTMSVVRSEFADNYCLAGGCDGGALFGFPTTTVDDVILVDNVAGYNGGGATLLGVLTMTNSLLQGNRTLNSNGGGLFGQDYAFISQTRFLDNQAQHQGGGLYMLGDLTLIDSEIKGNQSGHDGGGLIVYGDFQLERSRFIRNEGLRGGGLFHRLTADGVATNCLFLDNGAATGDGNALYLSAGGQLDLAHLTIAATSTLPGTALSVVSGTVQLRNSIVTTHSIGVSNTLGVVNEDYNLYHGNGLDLAGPINGGGHSLVGDPRFQGLAAEDFHLLPGSPAIDAALDLGIEIDLDSDPRPLLAGVDIGADEANPITGLQFTYMPSPVTVVGVATRFSATVTTGYGVTYEWDFADGMAPEVGNPISHAYEDEAVYTVIVTARNSSGMVQFSRPVTVVVAASAAFLPVVRQP